jgi:hypothetical protein
MFMYWTWEKSEIDKKNLVSLKDWYRCVIVLRQFFLTECNMWTWAMVQVQISDRVLWTWWWTLGSILGEEFSVCRRACWCQKASQLHVWLLNVSADDKQCLSELQGYMLIVVSYEDQRANLVQEVTSSWLSVQMWLLFKCLTFQHALKTEALIVTLSLCGCVIALWTVTVCVAVWLPYEQLLFV